MIRLTALDMLRARGKSRYWLNKRLNMGDQNLKRMLNNETKSIRYDVLENLCMIFDCTPNDLFEIDPDKPEGNRDGEA